MLLLFQSSDIMLQPVSLVLASRYWPDLTLRTFKHNLHSTLAQPIAVCDFLEQPFVEHLNPFFALFFNLCYTKPFVYLTCCVI